MHQTKPKAFLQNINSLRSDIRVIICVFLLLYILFAFSKWRQFNSKRNEVLSSLNILGQMQEFAKERCQRLGNKRLDSVEKYRKVLQGNKRKDVTKEAVNNEVTFILLAPTIRCLSSKISWLKSRYESARILVALTILLVTAPNEKDAVNLHARAVHFLGAFTGTPEALNHAVHLVNTKYFMIIEQEMDFASMQENFMELLLTNIPGYDILSSSVINTHGEFTIPCRRQELYQWSYRESFQYNISGNVLQCDATSLHFLARNEAFKSLIHNHKHVFDLNLSSKWLEDFFIRFREVLDVAVLPEVVIRQKVPEDCFNPPPAVLSTAKRAEMLLPFAKKHQLFYINDDTGRIDICKDAKSILSCSERVIQKEWGVRHWSDGGLTTYPFIIESLQNALHFGTRRLEESKLMYVIEGGTLLGLVKLRDILPWDHGDVDTFVYSTRRKVIDMVKTVSSGLRLRILASSYWLPHVRHGRSNLVQWLHSLPH